MLINEFIKHVEQASLSPVYLFVGDADLLMEEAWNRLLKRIVPANARHFNGERLSAKECPAAQVVARLSTIPMFGEKQLLMVQHIEDWPKEQRHILSSYLAHPFPTACLVMTTSKKKGLDKLESAVDATGLVVRFSAPTEREAPRWLQERARTHGKQLVPRAAFYLFEQVGLDLHRLESELEKLALYVGDRERIELEDVKQAVSSQRSFSVFELLRYVGQNQRDQAIVSLRNLILSGEAPLAILALLARQVRLVWQVKDGLERSLSHAQIGQKVGLPPFVIKNYVQQASQFTEDQLYHAHRALRKTDIAIKSTATAPEVMLEALILDLCGTQ